jgi:hypothetical protein
LRRAPPPHPITRSRRDGSGASRGRGPGGRRGRASAVAGPGGPLRGGAPGQRGAVRAAGARGLRGPVHAGREPRQVAPGPHHLVLRDLRAGAPPRPRALPSRFRVPVQLLLQQRGLPVPEAAAGPADSAHGGGGAGLPASRGRPDAGVPVPTRRALGRAGPDRGARAAPRAAAPGADPHRPEARLCPEPPASRLPAGRGPHPASCPRPGVDRVPRGAASHRPGGQGVLLRQRASPPPRASTWPSSRRTATRARSSGCRTVGARPIAGAGAPPSTGSGATASGGSSP